MRLLLFGTSGCHLCEQAAEIIDAGMPDDLSLFLENIDIAESEHWQVLYGQLIPVLYEPETNKELRWPFDQLQVKNFITGLKHD
jgi:hypothetical protein